MPEQSMQIARGNWNLFIFTTCLTKRDCKVLFGGVTAAEFSKQFVNHWSFSYRRQLALIANGCRQFRTKFFQDVCKILKVHKSFTIMYNPKIEGQVEPFHWTILTASPIPHKPSSWLIFLLVNYDVCLEPPTTDVYVTSFLRACSIEPERTSKDANKTLYPNIIH